DLRAEQPHAEDVQRLAMNVDLAHVDDAVEAEQGAGGRGGDAVLAGPGFGDDALLAHALREERLAEGVVDLVGAGVGEVLALEEDARTFATADFRREALRLVEGCRAADVLLRKLIDLGLERRVVLDLLVRRRELVDGRHQGFRRELAAEATEVAAGVRARSEEHTSELQS